MKRSSLSLLTIFMTLAISLSACSSKNDKSSPERTPSKEAIEQVKDEISAYRYQLPIDAGYGQLITDISYNPATYTINYTYQFTVPGVTKPNQTQIKQGREAAIEMLKTMPKEKHLLDQGFTFHYQYYTLENTFLYSLAISASDL